MDATCNVGMLNTGQACVPVMKVQKKIISVQTYDSTGVLNEIDLTAGPFDDTYLNARLNDTDASKRWFPLPSMKNVSDERADSLMETFDDGSKVYIEQGIRTFTGLVITSDAPPQMVKKIRAMRGVDSGVSVYSVDKEKNFIGKTGSSATKLAPVQLESDTIDAVFVKSVDKAIQKIKVSWDFNIAEDDADLRMIQSTEATWNVSGCRGLIDVTSVISAISGAFTGFTAALYTDAGTPITPYLMKGLVAADFVSSVGGATGKVRNQTTSADVAIVSVTESPAGVYTFVFAAQSSGDVIILKPKKAGYDYTAVEANTITFP